MTGDWFWATLPLVSLVVNIALQQGAFRLTGRRDAWGSIVVGFLGGLVLLVAMSFTSRSAASDLLAILGLNLLSYVACSHGYFNFVNLHLTSLRIRMLREFRRFDGPVTRRQLLAVYDGRQAVALRVRRLIEKGQMVERDGRYYVDGPNVLLVIAGILDFLKWLVFGSKRAH